MTLTRLVPGAPLEIDLEAEDASRQLAELYRSPSETWLRLNLIASINGNAAGTDGTSASLTSKVDRRILGVIRRQADLVLVGAASVRTEGYFLPKTAPLAIITSTGDLRGHRIPDDVAEGRVLIVCPPEAEVNVSATLGSIPYIIYSLPGPRIGLTDAIEVLRIDGYLRIVCEGGPSLAAQLIETELVDELCFSTSPELNSENVPLLQGLAGARKMTLTQLLIDSESGLYARWSLR